MQKKLTEEEKQAYAKMVEKAMPKRPMLPGLVRAFTVGGLICMLGQGVREFGTKVLSLSDDGVSAFSAIVLVFFGALLTGLGVYDKIGKFAGAGSIVPITGFANSVVAPAMEFKREGYVMGIGAKLFSLAGPVLVYGIGSSVVYGVIYWIIRSI